MQQATLADFNGVSSLTLSDTDIPQPGPGEVLIKVHAAALNYRDWEVLNGQYHESFAPGLVPLSDGAGEVVRCGEQVDGLQQGDRVVGSFWQGWQAGELAEASRARTVGGPINGWLSEYIVLPAAGVVMMPAHLSYAQAATLPCAAVTAWQSLVVKGHLRSGQYVLIQGTGGVSMFALQIARLHGASAIVLSSSDDKCALANQHGAFATLNYQHTPQWADKVRQLTDGAGVDHVVEVGGPNTMSQSLQALAPGGQINVIGYLGGKDGSINPLQILQSHAQIRGIAAGPTATLAQLCQAYAANALTPLIDQQFDWTDYGRAFERLAAGKHVGKIVLNF